MSLVYDFTRVDPFNDPPPELAATPEDVLDLLGSHLRIGFWRSDYATGHVFFSPETWRIHGFEPKAGPVNLVELNKRFHPDDLPLCLKIFENAARNHNGFQYTLRISDGRGGYKYARSVGRYRDTPDGAGQTIGIFHEIPSEP